MLFYILYHSKQMVADQCQLNGYLHVVYSISLEYLWKGLHCTELKSVSLWFLSIGF